MSCIKPAATLSFTVKQLPIEIPHAVRKFSMGKILSDFIIAPAAQLLSEMARPQSV